MPPSGIGLERSSSTMPPASERCSRNGSARGDAAEPLAPSSAGCRADVAALGTDGDDSLERRRRPGSYRRAGRAGCGMRGSSRSSRILVEDRDALADIVDGRSAGGRGCAGWRRRHRRGAAGAARIGRMALEQQRQDEAGGGRADGAGQQMLGEAQHADVGFGLGVMRDLPRCANASGTRALCARRRDSAPPSPRDRSTVTAVRHSRKPARCGAACRG